MSIKVLVVEDEALLLFSIADELRDAGYEVIEASNAAQAIAILDRDPGIDLVFTDIDMPGDMDGLALSAAVRRRWPPVRIIVTSGKDLPRGRDLPAEGVFLPKPYSPIGVVTAIQGLRGA
jgi:CheY-like chemotaxis protein